MVYLIHFDRPYKQAKHYLGYTANLQSRLDLHASGAGANLLRVLKHHGIGWQLVRVWDGGRDVERRLKSIKNAPRLCPICNRRVCVELTTAYSVPSQLH
jgi:predicted GIY-YIG superfamily endonuclease